MENDVRQFWEKHSNDHMKTAYKYSEESGMRYPFYEIRMDRLIDILSTLKKGKILDAGCGGGQVMTTLLNDGWDVDGFDASKTMVSYARDAILAVGHDPGRVIVGDMTDLGIYPNEHYDVIYTLGVIEYLRDHEEALFYSEARRVLKPGGILVVEYINEIFNISTFNRFTINFFEKMILPHFLTDAQEICKTRDAIAQLITYPDKPDRTGKWSTTQDQVFTRSDNPFTFNQRAADFGFHMTDLLFYRFHVAPPLVFEKYPDLEKAAISIERKLCHHWIGYFMASGFMARLEKPSI